MAQLNIKARIVALILMSALILAACDTGGAPATSTTPTSVAVATQPRATSETGPTSDVPIATKAPTSVAASTQLPSGEWYLVDSEQGGFSVQMPGQPNEGTSPIKDNAGNTIDLHTFVSSKTTAEYTMTYADYPDQVAALGAEAMLNNTLTGALGKNTAIGKKNITVGGSPGMEVEFVDQASQNYAWYMSVARDNRIYQLIVVATGKDAPDADARRFFDSLTLTRAISEGTPEPTASSGGGGGGGGGGDWQLFTSAQGGFSIDMPGQPEASTQPSSGGATSYVFSASKDGRSYMASYTDLPASASGFTPKQLLDSTRDGAATSSGGELVEEQEITLGQYPGRDFTLNVELLKNSIRQRAFLVGPRLYQIVTTGPGDDVNSADADRFFNSFRLAGMDGTSRPTAAPTRQVAGRTPTASGGGGTSGGDWQTYRSPDGKFSVDMPGQPQESTQPVDAGMGPMDLHTLGFGTTNGAYTVIYADLPDAALQAGAAPVLEGALNGVAGQNAVQNQENVTVQGNPGIAGEFEAPGTGYTRYAAILVQNRLYQIITLTPDKSTNAEGTQRFFSSFKLAP